MAKTIATVGGIALAPGVSKNGRLYTREAIGKMVARAQERITSGGKPLTMLSHHGADDDSTRIVGRITSISQDDDGAARFTAGIADTDAGRDIASLLDTSDGNPPFLKNESIRGFWVGPVRKTAGPDGSPVETAGDLELDGLDLTRSPGVARAAVDAFAWASGGKTETTERVPITESVQEARVTAIAGEVTEGQKSCEDMGHQCCTDAAAGKESAPDGGASEASDAKTDAPAGTTYADPGYLKDGKKRYPLNTAKRIRAAWSYINQKDNADQYSASQLKRIKGKIKAAMGRIGATVTAEGWAIWPPEQVAETDAAVAEYMGDGPGSGSFSICASNGPLSITMSSWCVDPADLDLILRAVAAAAADALKAIDPDMDGDMDIPGAGSEDPDGDAGETAPDEPGPDSETSPADEAGGEAAPAADTQEEAVTDATNTETAAAAPASVTLTTEQFDALLARVAPQPPAATETETPAAPPATPAAETPAAPASTATETADQRMARLTALAEAKVAEAAAAAGLAVAETDEQIMERLVAERLTPLVQAAAERNGTGTARKGLLESIASEAAGSTKILQETSGEDLALLAGAAYPPAAGLRR